MSGIVGSLDTFGPEAVDDAHYAAAQLGFRNDDFHRIGGGAVDGAHFRHPEALGAEVDSADAVVSAYALHHLNLQ